MSARLAATWPRSFAAYLIAGAAVAGCGTTGTMLGQVSGSGASPRPVTLSYETHRTGDSGTLAVALPGGESFTGPLTRLRTAGTVAGSPGINLDVSAIEWGQAADQWTFRRDDSDKMVALLQGDHGHVMRCQFTLLYPPGGLRNGGTGECQASSGERIDVRF